MRVLMQSRKNFFTLRGGDTVQLEKTKAELEKLGVEVDISLEFEPDLSNYDIVHVSNVTRIQETYLHVKNAKKQGKPVVLSTIFWPMDEFEKQGQKGIRKIIGRMFSINQEEKLKAAVRYLLDKTSRNISTKNMWRVGYKEMQQYVVNNVDYYLPNSKMEMEQFSKYFNIPMDKYIVVPNAIDADIAKNALESSNGNNYEQFDDSIICVGRIETRKNQLSLVKALDGSGYKLFLVGKPSTNQPNYYKEIMKIVSKNPGFKHIESIPNHELYQIYKRCKVSTLPSWLDTPGLVSLEAAAMGCNLAVSTRGSTKEYFKEYAYYCEPDDLESIRMAVENAYNAKANNELQKLIFENYNWAEAAKQTYIAYKEVLRLYNKKKD